MPNISNFKTPPIWDPGGFAKNKERDSSLIFEVNYQKTLYFTRPQYLAQRKGIRLMAIEGPQMQSKMLSVMPLKHAEDHEDN